MFAGDLAPFDGQLFTNAAAACLFVELDGCIAQAQAELERRDALCHAALETAEEDCAVQLAAREEEIAILENSLEDALTRPWYQRPGFLLTAGFVGGAVVGILVGSLVQ